MKAALSAVADQPWSWVVAVGCGWKMVWLTLVTRSGALIFATLVSDYGASREQAAWIFNVNTSAACVTALLVGFLIKCNVSAKAISLFGSLVVGVSAILCYLTTNTTFLFLLLGICSGIGIGASMFINNILISQYFVRYRASATGINHFGGALAAFVYPPIFLMLINRYGLRGALLISGGLSLNSLAGSLLLPTPTQTNYASEGPKHGQVVDSIGSEDTAHGRDEPRTAFLVSGGKDAAVLWEGQKHQREESEESFTVPLKRVDTVVVDGCVIGTCTNLTPATGSLQSKMHCTCSAMDKEDLLGASPLVCSEESQLPLSANGYHPRGPSLPGETCTSSTADATRFPSVVSYSSCMPHFEFLKFPAFYLSTMSGLGLTYTMQVFFILVDFAQEKGLSKQDGVTMLCATSIADACARMASGIVSDRRILSRRTMISASNAMAGIACFALPLVYSYPVLLALCSLFGWAFGSILVLLAPIMADNVGVQHIALAFGVNKLIMGVAYLGCPKLTGHFKDDVGSYTGLFYVIGSGCFVVAGLWIGETVRIRMKRPSTVQVSSSAEKKHHRSRCHS